VPAIRAVAMPGTPITLWRLAGLRLAERRDAVPLLSVPSGSRSQMPPKGFIRAAMPQSWLEGNTQAPGGGLPASRMHQVSARAGAASRTKSPAKRPAPGIFPVCFIHLVQLHELVLDKTPLAP